METYHLHLKAMGPSHMGDSLPPPPPLVLMTLRFTMKISPQILFQHNRKFKMPQNVIKAFKSLSMKKRKLYMFSGQKEKQTCQPLITQAGRLGEKIIGLKHGETV